MEKKIIGLSDSCDSIYLYSNLDQFGNVDSSNIYNYEQFNLVIGTDEFEKSTEIAISKDFAELLVDNVEDVLGMQIMLGTSGNQKAYSVKGVFESITAERRINKDAFEKIDNFTENDRLKYTVLTSKDAIYDYITSEYDIYVFFDNDQEYSEYKNILLSLEGDENISNKFSCITHEDVNEMNQAEWSSYTDIKCALMIVISFISGISRHYLCVILFQR